MWVALGYWPKQGKSSNKSKIRTLLNHSGKEAKLSRIANKSIRTCTNVMQPEYSSTTQAYDASLARHRSSTRRPMLQAPPIHPAWHAGNDNGSNQRAMTQKDE